MWKEVKRDGEREGGATEYLQVIAHVYASQLTNRPVMGGRDGGTEEQYSQVSLSMFFMGKERGKKKALHLRRHGLLSHVSYPCPDLSSGERARISLCGGGKSW